MISGDSICFLAWAFLLLALPLDWVLSMAAAAIFHEVCHILAVMAAKGKIRRIRIFFGGCEIETEPLSTARSVLSILAGPVGSLLLVLLRRSIPKTAVCGLIQGLYNLLPVYPLDGGRILYYLLEGVNPQRRERIMNMVFYLLCVAIGLSALMAAVSQHWNVLSVYGCLLGNIALIRRKIPCKANRIGLQWY